MLTSDIDIRRCIVTSVHEGDGFLALVTVDCVWGVTGVQIRNMRLIRLNDGRIILAMPSRRDKSGKHYDVVLFLSAADHRKALVMARKEYDRLLERGATAELR